MKTRDKKDEMILTLALLEQMENDEDLKAFDACADETTGQSGTAGQGAKPHVFSERHNQRMKEIFKIAARAEKRRKRRRIVKRAAAGLAACICVSTCMVFSSSAFRIPVMNFFTDVKEKYSELVVDKGTKTYVTKNFQEYEPRYVPKGFNVAEVVEEDNFFKIRYVNDNGQWYYFACYEYSHSANVDTENAVKKEIETGENNITVYVKEGNTQAIMYQNFKQFVISGEIDLDEIQKIFESIK
ncbi:putative uncharacterized protein [Clostridium sp. CAG:149]|nr:putative uncharacterized protein [Clostridium sp. CAG:149]